MYPNTYWTQVPVYPTYPIIHTEERYHFGTNLKTWGVTTNMLAIAKTSGFTVRLAPLLAWPVVKYGACFWPHCSLIAVSDPRVLSSGCVWPQSFIIWLCLTPEFYHLAVSDPRVLSSGCVWPQSFIIWLCLTPEFYHLAVSDLSVLSSGCVWPQSFIIWLWWWVDA